MVRNPKHVAMILDGNRRFARKHAWHPFKGHEKGLEKMNSVLRWCKELEFEELTVYAFSIQNFKRAKEEVKLLMGLFIKASEDLFNSKEEELKELSIRFIGRRELLPQNVQEAMMKEKEKTKHNKPYKLNVCLAYGGREEIADATKIIAQKVQKGELKAEDINETTLNEHLQLQSEPDMIIRTSYEHRTSNFLPWQSWYSEWYFLKKLWPEIEKEDLIQCVEEFKQRDRRFGAK